MSGEFVIFRLFARRSQESMIVKPELLFSMSRLKNIGSESTAGVTELPLLLRRRNRSLFTGVLQVFRLLPPCAIAYDASCSYGFRSYLRCLFVSACQQPQPSSHAAIRHTAPASLSRRVCSATFS